MSEAARVVRASGHVLLAFQVGSGSRDVATGYRAMGHDVSLTPYHRSLAHMEDVMRGEGFSTVARLERALVAGEQDPQAFLLCARPL